jgi:hypothetical protein
MGLHPDGSDFHKAVRALLAAGGSEAEKLARVFLAVTGMAAESTRREIELASALGDGELKVKRQIQLETMEHARHIFRTCHLQVTGRRTEDDPDAR